MHSHFALTGSDSVFLFFFKTSTSFSSSTHIFNGQVHAERKDIRHMQTKHNNNDAANLASMPLRLLRHITNMAFVDGVKSPSFDAQRSDRLDTVFPHTSQCEPRFVRLSSQTIMYGATEICSSGCAYSLASFHALTVKSAKKIVSSIQVTQGRQLER